MTYSRSQISWSYYLLIIVRLKGGMRMGAHFSTVEMDNAIRFSIVSGPLQGVSVPVA